MALPTLSTYGGILRDVGYAGQMVDLNPNVMETYVNDAVLIINFGAAVARSANDNTCKAPLVDGDKILGIAVRHGIFPSVGYAQGGTNLINYAQFSAVPVLFDGLIYVIAAENVTRDDQALSLTASNGTIGGTTGGAAGSGRVVIPNARWMTTTAVGIVGIVRINN